jgi:hypothetical protein
MNWAMVVMVVLVAGDARACSCGSGSGDLAKDLKDALASPHIYRARVVGLSHRVVTTLLNVVQAARRQPKLADDLAMLEVLEVFRGGLRVGQHLEVSNNNGFGSGCDPEFAVGEDLLIYTLDGDPKSISGCSRTREVTPTDLELDWLRTGVLPPLPVAVRREVVTCDPCTLDSLAGSLPRAWGADALRHLTDANPFMNGGYYGLPSERKGVVRTATGETFMLLQRPDYGTGEVCFQRVSRQSCAGFAAHPTPPRGEPDLDCVTPGPEVPVCDESTSRRATWGPPQDMSAVTCTWRDPAHPRCEFSKSDQPLAEGKPTFPLLECSPAYDRRDSTCHVVTR